MSKVITLGLVLSMAGFGAAAGAVGSVNSRIASIGKTLDSLKGQQKTALDSMHREWASGGNGVIKYATEIDRLAKKIDQLAAKKAKLQALGQVHDANRAALSKGYGDVIAGVGIGGTVAVPGVLAAKFEDRVKQISIVGELYKLPGQEDAMARAIREAAVAQGISQDKIAEGVEKLVAQGMEANSAKRLANLLGRVSVATRTEMGDLAELVYTLQTKFKLRTEGELMQGINALAKAGKLGQYEIKQMAKGFPALGGQAASFGSVGIEGVREMGMMMQVMRAGAGTTGDADTYMANWFSKMSAKNTQEEFGKVGIDFEKSKLKLMLEKRVSAIEASFMVVDEYLGRVTNRGFVTIQDGKKTRTVDVRKELAAAAAAARSEGLQGEALQAKVMAAVQRVGLSAVFQDMQVTQAYLAYMTGKEKYLQGREELAKASTNQTIDNDYAEQARLATVQTERLKVVVADLGIEVGRRFTPVWLGVAKGLSWAGEAVTAIMQRYPTTTTVVLGLAAGLATAAGGFLLVGAGMAALRFAGTALQLMPLLGGGLMMLGKGAGWAVIALRAVGTAVLFVGRALLLNPIGLAVTAIAGAAYLLYRNWTPVVAWFKALPGQFAEFGRNMIDGLVGGVSSRFNAAKTAVVGLGQSIKGWFTNTLGIKSPSRVFMGFGQNIGEGAELGILASVPGVKDAVAALSALTLTGAAAAGQVAPAKPQPGAGSASAITVHFAPTINVGAGSGDDVRAQVQQGLHVSMRELETLIRRVQQEQARKAY